MSKNMKAIKRFLFNGRLLKEGEVFEVTSDNEAREFEQAGLAEYDTKQVRARKADTEFATDMNATTNATNAQTPSNTMDTEFASDTMDAGKVSNQANSTLSENAFNAEMAEDTNVRAKRTNKKSE